MSKKSSKKGNHNKLPSTKNMEGRRVNGILYIERGVGSGLRSHVNYSGSSNEFGGSSQIISGCINKSRDEDY